MSLADNQEKEQNGFKKRKTQDRLEILFSVFAYNIYRLGNYTYTAKPTTPASTPQ